MVIILMGVSGAGKTTVGRLLAAELGWRFYEADAYHSAASVEKMRGGVPLDDADRGPWLEARRGHYMSPGLLGSQFDALEEPANALRVNVSSSPGEIVKEIRSRLGL